MAVSLADLIELRSKNILGRLANVFLSEVDFVTISERSGPFFSCIGYFIEFVWRKSI
jgi:hypothetical protein